MVVPHMWEEHQRPFDFFRYTSGGIRYLMERAGIHYLLISLTVLIVVPMFNFAGHRVFTFGGRAK